MSGDFEQAKSRVCQSEGAYVSVRPLASSWEQRKLGELYSLVSEKNDLTFGRESIISVANMYFNANVNVTDEQYLRTYNVMRLGDIAFEGHSNKEFSHGRFVENYIGDGIVSHIFTVLRPRVPLDVNYWRYAINNEKLMRLSLIRSTKASTMMHDLVPSDFLREAIPTPTLAEQKEIGAFLVGLDHLITLHQRKCQYRSLYGYLSWEQRKLGDVATIVGGGTPSTNNEAYWDGDIDWYSPAELGEQVYADRSVRRITQAGYDSCSATLLPAGKTILFTSRAGIGNTAILRRSACTNQGFQSLVVNDDTDVYFVYSMTDRVKKFAEQKASGSTFLEISGKGLAAGEFAFPSKDEQTAIGSMFKQLDHLITLHQRKCQYRSLYGYLSWEQRKFSDVFDFLRNNTLSRAELSESEGHTLNIHYGDILVKFGEVIDANRDALPRIADDGLTERLSCHSLADGDVIIADTAEDEAVGKCSELRGCGSERIVSGLHTMACRPMDEFAQGYLGYYLNSPAFHNQLLPLMQGIKVISVSKGAISDTDVRFPSLPEQHAIGQSLSSLDSLITLHQREPRFADTG